MKTVIDILTILLVLLPPAVQIASALAQKSHSAKFQNLMQRANVIVQALEQSGLTNDEKKQEGLKKISNYATEVGIKLTADQADDYIEAAVRFMKLSAK